MADIEQIKAKGAINAVYAEVDKLVTEATNGLRNLRSGAATATGQAPYRKFGAGMDAVKDKLDEAREFLNEVRKLERE